jgi:hypothetical protein
MEFYVDYACKCMGRMVCYMSRVHVEVNGMQKGHETTVRRSRMR